MYNRYFPGKNKNLGITACSLAYNYLMENYKYKLLIYPLIEANQYPLPTEIVKNIYDEVDELLIIEEGYLIIEDLLAVILTMEKLSKDVWTVPFLFLTNSIKTSLPKHLVWKPAMFSHSFRP